jgi:stalled ribosome alternative rescue factor ArfA
MQLYLAEHYPQSIRDVALAARVPSTLYSMQLGRKRKGKSGVEREQKQNYPLKFASRTKATYLTAVEG